MILMTWHTQRAGAGFDENTSFAATVAALCWEQCELDCVQYNCVNCVVCSLATWKRKPEDAYLQLNMTDFEFRSAVACTHKRAHIHMHSLSVKIKHDHVWNHRKWMHEQNWPWYEDLTRKIRQNEPASKREKQNIYILILTHIDMCTLTQAHTHTHACTRTHTGTHTKVSM